MQCVVEMAQAQTSSYKRILHVESWLRNALHHLPQEEHDEYFQRGQELCLQYLCQTKLQLAIQNGLKQETTLLSPDAFAQELEHTVRQSGHSLKATILAELDVPTTGEDAERPMCSIDEVPVDERRQARPSHS